jgi:AcrR family transcriptional regulator
MLKLSLNARGDFMVVSKSIKPGPRDDRGVLAGRILDAARKSFAEDGWAGTSIRAIARAADVDPALIYHYYGSKQDLLEACTTPPPGWLARMAATWATPREQLGVRLVTDTLENWSNPQYAPTIRSILLIAAHDAGTRVKLRDLVQNSLMGPAASHLEEEERLVRAGLIASQLLGLGFMRYIWLVEPIASMTDAEVIAAVAPTVQRYIDADLGGPGQPPARRRPGRPGRPDPGTPVPRPSPGQERR